jgi:photosystem II stability/assembly factor-like uncharacterized protein
MHLTSTIRKVIIEEVVTMRKWLIFCALLLVACEGEDNGQAPSADDLASLAEGDWTARLTVPLPISDVVWDGQVFIAVGSRGAVLTSADGVDWVARESATEDNLNAVAVFGSDIYAVGESIILLSTDHGETWAVKARPDFPGNAVAADSSRVIVMGTVGDLFVPRITISEDRGNTWHDIAGFSWNVGDLIYRDGLFVAPALAWPSLVGGTRVIVSPDGKQWNEILVREEDAQLKAIVHDDSQFFVAGEQGTVFSSFDALNWTKLTIPGAVDFSGGASDGTQLILAGGSIAMSSNDGGESWDTFRIDTGYQSASMACGNGRFVSVGRLLLSDEGAIYTSD